MLLTPAIAAMFEILCVGASAAPSDEIALAAIANRLSSWTTIAAEVEIAARPNPEAAPETVYGAIVQNPYDHTMTWQWSATGREWLELLPIRRPGQGHLDRVAYAVDQSESWAIIYDRETGERIHNVTCWRKAVQPPERGTTAILPAALGLNVPGLDGGIRDLLRRRNPPSVSAGDTGVIVDFGACPIPVTTLYVKARFLPEREWALAEVSVRDPTARRAPRRDGSTVEQETRIVVDEWRTIQDEGTGETVWFPERVTRTTSAGVYTMQLRNARVGFSPDQIRGCPELPSGTRVQEISPGPGEPVKNYLIGGEAALNAQMEAHVAAARQALLERERTGQRFDARPPSGIGWSKPALIVSLLMLIIGAGWRWRRMRMR